MRQIRNQRLQFSSRLGELTRRLEMLDSDIRSFKKHKASSSSVDEIASRMKRRKSESSRSQLGSITNGLKSVQEIIGSLGKWLSAAKTNRDKLDQNKNGVSRD